MAESLIDALNVSAPQAAPVQTPAPTVPTLPPLPSMTPPTPAAAPQPAPTPAIPTAPAQEDDFDKVMREMQAEADDASKASQPYNPTVVDPSTTEVITEDGTKPLPSDTNVPVQEDGTQPEAPQPTGILSRIGAGAKALFSADGGKGVLAGAARIPGQVAGGLMDAEKDIEKAVLGPTMSQYTVVGMLSASGEMDRPGFSNFADTLSMRKSLGAVGNDNINQGTAVIGSLVAGAFGASEARGVAALPNILKWATAGGSSAGLLMDPSEERLSNGLQSLGVKNDFVDWLAAKPGEETHIEARLKNTLENALSGAALDATFYGIKAAYYAAKGLPAEAQAMKDAAQAAGKDLIPPSVPTKVEVVAGDVPQPAASVPETSVGQAPTTSTPKYTLTKTTASAEDLGKDKPGEFVYKFSAGDGTEKGILHIDSIEKGVARIGDIFTPSGANSLGPSSIRGLLRQLKAEHPEITSFTGERVSGARFGGAHGFEGQGTEVKVSLPSKDITIVAHQGTESRPLYVGSKAEFEKFQAEVAANKELPAASMDIQPDTAAAIPNGAFKLSPLGDTDAVPAVYRAVVDRLGPSARPRSDAELMESARVASEAMGEDPTTILAAAKAIAGTTGDIDTAIVTQRSAAASLSREVDTWATRDIGTMSPDDLSQAQTAIHNVMMQAGYYMQIKTGLGRGLRAMNLPDYDTYMKQVKDPAAEHAVRATTPASTIPPLPLTPEDTATWLQLWKATKDNPEARQGFLQGIQTLPSAMTYMRTSLANLFTANVLAGMPSIAMNVVGPSIIKTVRFFERTSGAYMASLIAPTIAKVAGQADRQSLLLVAPAAVKGALSIGEQAAQGFHYAVQAAKENHSIIGGGNSIDSASRIGPITDAMLEATKQSPSVGYALGNLINMWPRAFQRLNQGLDEFSKRVSYLNEAKVSALVEGGAQGLSGQELKDFVKTSMAASVDEVGRATDKALLASAEKTTFTGAVGSEGSTIREGANWIQHMRATVPEMRYIIPVFNVPANAIGETMARIPVLNFALKETRDELLGRMGPIRQADAYGRTLMGASFLTAGMMMAKAGQITGAGPTDPQAMKIWAMTHQPYSIRSGDKWVKYDRYDLIGSLIGIPATMFDKSVYSPQDKDWETTTYAAIGALAQYFRDRAALQTASDFFALGSQGVGHDQNMLQRFIGSVSTRLVVPNFVTQLGRGTTDDLKRTKTNTFDYLLDALPGTSKLLDPMRNVLGEPIHQPRDSLTENMAPITISPASSYADDPVTDELSRIYEKTGYAGGVTSQAEISHGTFDARQVLLEDGRSLYDHVVSQRMEPDEVYDGMTVRDRLKELFDSDEYNDAVDGDANGTLDSNGNENRGALISKVFSQTNKSASQKVASESPIARRWLAVAKAKQTDDASLRGYSANDLVKNPPLLASLGIDISSFEDTVSGN